MDTTVEHFIYDSGKDGTSLAILGAIHGNEKCGTLALERLKKKLDSKEIRLLRGKLAIIPVCNPEAYKANKRFIDRNLNRSLYPKTPQQRKVYEDHLDHQICGVIEKADYLLDIHSYASSGPPFVFIGGKNADEKHFAESLNVTRSFVWGWQDAFGATNPQDKYAWGTTEFGRSVGVKGLTLECGLHTDPKAPDVAYAAIMHALNHFKMIYPETLKEEVANLNLPAIHGRQFAKMVTVIKNENIRLARDFRHFEPLKKGDVLAIAEGGRYITVAADGYAILPHPEAVKGAELVYLAVDEEPMP